MKKEVLIVHEIETRAMALTAQELEGLITQLSEGCNLAVSTIEKELEKIL